MMNLYRVGILCAAIFLSLAMNSALVFAETETEATDVQNAVTAVSSAESARVERMGKLHALTKQLAEEQDYALKGDERLTYLANAESEPRSALYYLVMNEHIWAEPPDEYPFEMFTLMFLHDSKGGLNWQHARKGITTLKDVMEMVLGLRPNEYECAPGLLTTYMPGDWILSWNRDRSHDLSNSDLAAFEKILSEQLDLGVTIGWETVKRPALVITGDYKASPPKRKLQPDVAQHADGWFEIPTRGTDTASKRCDYAELLQTIGEVLMLPVIDETTTRPTKRGFFLEYPYNPSVDSPLELAAEADVLKSLHEQMGYEFAIEPREVKLLSIEQTER
jgi:hypothetical protein